MNRPTPTPVHSFEQPTPSRGLSLNDGDLQTPVELRDFMSELGVIMQLPKKTTVAMRAVPEPATLRAARKGVVLPAIAVALMAVVGATKVLTPPLPSDTPPALIGEWRTTSPEYAERRLAFAATGVGIALDSVKPATWYPIESVVMRATGDTTSYELTYTEFGEPVKFLVHHVPSPKRHLLLSNPPGVVWEPAVASAPPK